MKEREREGDKDGGVLGKCCFSETVLESESDLVFKIKRLALRSRASCPLTFNFLCLLIINVENGNIVFPPPPLIKDLYIDIEFFRISASPF